MSLKLLTQHAQACIIGKVHGQSQLSRYSMVSLWCKFQGKMCGRRVLGAVQIKTETAHVNLDITLTGSSGAFNVTMPGMSVVCYELQTGDNVESTMSSSSGIQSHTRA